jgi:hypothetical protein
MGGLGFLLTIILYVVIAIFVVRAFKRRWTRIVAAAVAILLPTTDAVIGRIYLKHLCETEGGPKVNRVLHGVEGFRWDGGIAMRAPDDETKRFLSRFGVRFIESELQKNGKVDRVSLIDGRVVRESGVTPRSAYLIRFMRKERGSRYVEQRNQIESVANGEIIASDSQFIFEGGWAEHLLGRFADSGPGSVARCEGPPAFLRRETLVRKSLMPN